MRASCVLSILLMSWSAPANDRCRPFFLDAGLKGLAVGALLYLSPPLHADELHDLNQALHDCGRQAPTEFHLSEELNQAVSALPDSGEQALTQFRFLLAACIHGDYDTLVSAVDDAEQVRTDILSRASFDLKQMVSGAFKSDITLFGMDYNPRSSSLEVLSSLLGDFKQAGYGVLALEERPFQAAYGAQRYKDLLTLANRSGLKVLDIDKFNAHDPNWVLRSLQKDGKNLIAISSPQIPKQPAIGLSIVPRLGSGLAKNRGLTVFNIANISDTSHIPVVLRTVDNGGLYLQLKGLQLKAPVAIHPGEIPALNDRLFQVGLSKFPFRSLDAVIFYPPTSQRQVSLDSPFHDM